MNKATSLYLDLVRFLAALVVFVFHFAYARFSGGDLQFIRDTKIGSDAVMLFFVLVWLCDCLCLRRAGQECDRVCPEPFVEIMVSRDPGAYSHGRC